MKERTEGEREREKRHLDAIFNENGSTRRKRNEEEINREIVSDDLEGEKQHRLPCEVFFSSMKN